MNIVTIGLSVLLVGIPLYIGAFFLVSYFGQSKASVGASGLITGLAIAGAIAFFMREARLTRDGDYVFTLPWVVVGALLLGVVTGYIARRRRNSSG